VADKTVIITGGNAGLGYQCARNIALSDTGYHPVLACRSLPRGESAAIELRAETNNPNITVMELDLASLASVRAFCDTFSQMGLPPLYAVVCNAGISAGGAPGMPRTVDGFETIFAVNHLGHFLLTNLLLNQMGDSGRIVFVASDLHNPPAFLPVKVTYDNAAAIANRGPGLQQYCTSKLCNIYCAYEMAGLLSEQTDRHITVNAFNPGAMSDTGFAKPAGNALTRGAVRVVGGIVGTLIGKQSTAIASGAALARLITDPALATTTSTYIDRGVEVPSSPLSHDRDNARELWQASMTMTALRESDTIFPPTQHARVMAARERYDAAGDEVL
jgi:NAD(P)-dependent dehydrogenase (short-subunit alcohol dehydrogenase family)